MSGEFDRWDLTKRLSEAGEILGGTLALHHRLAYGRWWDEKLECHGRFGAWLFSASSLIRLACEFLEPPRCPHCRSRLTYVPQYQRYYCENCLEYVN